MRKLLTLFVVLIALSIGTALAVAGGGGGWHHGGGSGHSQYNPKPGCGPDKNDGYAGKSGRHSGQPPKDDNRGDCPKPPGQQCKDKGSYKSGFWWHHDSKPSSCKPPDRHCYHSKSSSKYKKNGKYYWWYGWDCSYNGKWYDKDKDHSH